MPTVFRKYFNDLVQDGYPSTQDSEKCRGKKFLYFSWDLNNEYQNNKDIWLMYFCLSGIQMVVWHSDHILNTGLNLVQYSNGIWIPDHLVIGQLSTIWPQVYPVIQIPTVLTSMKMPITARPSAWETASSGVWYLELFQWTKCNWNKNVWKLTNIKTVVI